MTTTQSGLPRLHSNTYLGARLGLSHAQVSRIRSGDRLPSIDSMVRIASVLKWSVKMQIEARSGGKYAEWFELYANRHVPLETKDQA